MKLLPSLLSLLTSSVVAAASPPAVPIDPNTSIKPTPPALLTFSFPPTAALPNPQSLPARTHALLTTANLTLQAYLRRNSTFVFDDVPLGSYLAEIQTGPAGVNTVPMRVDVTAPGGGFAETPGVSVKKEDKSVKIWQTFRGNEWDNKGQLLGEGSGKEGVRADVQVLNVREVYEKRSGFSIMSLLSNPMILMGVVAMAVMFGMPKLMQNMDPEMKEEFEKQQRASTFANALTGQGGGGFDAAGWLAGTASKDTSAAVEDAPAKSNVGQSSGTANKGGKKRRG